MGFHNGFSSYIEPLMDSTSCEFTQNKFPSGAMII